MYEKITVEVGGEVIHEEVVKDYNALLRSRYLYTEFKMDLLKFNGIRCAVYVTATSIMNRKGFEVQPDWYDAYINAEMG